MGSIDGYVFTTFLWESHFHLIKHITYEDIFITCSLGAYLITIDISMAREPGQTGPRGSLTLMT